MNSDFTDINSKIIFNFALVFNAKFLQIFAESFILIESRKNAESLVPEMLKIEKYIAKDKTGQTK
jgi:hypothetical protein